MKKCYSVLAMLAVFALAIPCTASLVTDHGAPFYTTVPEGQAAATKAGTPMLVKFYTDW